MPTLNQLIRHGREEKRRTDRTRALDQCPQWSAYECGFDPFGDARSRFDIRFYLVSILFIIFDLEVIFFFPWALSLNKIDLFGFWSMMAFLLILTIGFFYEWKRGALDWE